MNWEYNGVNEVRRLRTVFKEEADQKAKRHGELMAVLERIATALEDVADPVSKKGRSANPGSGGRNG